MGVSPFTVRVCPYLPLSFCASSMYVPCFCLSVPCVYWFLSLCVVFVSLFGCAGSVCFFSCVLVFWFLIGCVCVLVSVCVVCWWSCVCLWFVCFVSCGVWCITGWGCVLCLRLCWLVLCLSLVRVLVLFAGLLGLFFRCGLLVLVCLLCCVLLCVYLVCFVWVCGGFRGLGVCCFLFLGFGLVLFFGGLLVFCFLLGGCVLVWLVVYFCWLFGWFLCVGGGWLRLIFLELYYLC